MGMGQRSAGSHFQTDIVGEANPVLANILAGYVIMAC